MSFFTEDFGLIYVHGDDETKLSNLVFNNKARSNGDDDDDDGDDVAPAA